MDETFVIIEGDKMRECFGVGKSEKIICDFSKMVVRKCSEAAEGLSPKFFGKF